jgi:hypothetical protein
MRNLAGGVLGALVGTLLAPVLLAEPVTAYPPPFDGISWILSGGALLQRSFDFFVQTDTAIPLLIIWLIIGVVMAPFATSKWNAFRTSIWSGVLIAVLALASVLLGDASFWESASRNLILLVNFSISIIAAQTSVLASLPIIEAIMRFQGRGQPQQVKEIRTVCQCGAEFKSIPLICSECGRRLTGNIDDLGK